MIWRGDGESQGDYGKEVKQNPQGGVKPLGVCLATHRSLDPTIVYRGGGVKPPGPLGPGPGLGGGPANPGGGMGIPPGGGAVIPAWEEDGGDGGGDLGRPPVW